MTMKIAVAVVLGMASLPARPAAADDIPTISPTLTVTASASSTLTQKGKTYDPISVLGGDPARFWCEGKPDEGIGEALVLRFASPTKIDSLTLRLGVWRSPELFRANNRISALDIVTDNGTKHVTTRTERENIDVAIGGAAITKLELRIAQVDKGKMNDSCISGVDIHTSPQASIVLASDAPATPPLVKGFEAAWKAMAACDEKAFKTALVFPFVLAENWNKPKRYADAAAVRKACKAVAFTAFDHSTSFTVKPDGIDKARLDDETLEWHFVLVKGAWKLASFVDGTP